MCHSKPSGHAESALVPQVVEPQEQGRPAISKVFNKKTVSPWWTPPMSLPEPISKVFEWPGHHFRCLLLIGKVSPGCTSWIARSLLSIQTCLVHHSGSLLRTKSSAYVLELERAVISVKASMARGKKTVLWYASNLLAIDLHGCPPYPGLHRNCLEEEAHFSKELKSDEIWHMMQWHDGVSCNMCPSGPTLASSTPDIARYLSVWNHSWNTQTERFHACPPQAVHWSHSQRKTKCSISRSMGNKGLQTAQICIQAAYYFRLPPM